MREKLADLCASFSIVAIVVMMWGIAWVDANIGYSSEVIQSEGQVEVWQSVSKPEVRMAFDAQLVDLPAT